MSVGSDWNPTAAGYVDLDKQSLDIWALVRRRKWLVIFMVIVGGLLGWLYYVKATRIYETAAQVLVTKNGFDEKSPITPVDPQLSYAARLTNHIQLICSPVVVQQAVDKFRLHELTSFQDQNIQPQNVAAKIISDMETGRAGGREALDTDIMQINYRSTNYVDAMTVVKAVVRSYQDFLGQNYQSASEDAVQKITLAKQVLETGLAKDRSDLQRFMKDAPGGIEFDAAEHMNPAEEAKRKIILDRDAVKRRRAELQATLATIKESQSQGVPTRSLIMHIEKYRKADDMDNVREVQSFADIAFPVMLEHEQAAERYGQNHPTVKALALKLKLIQDQIDHYNMRRMNDSTAKNTPEQFIADVLETMQIDLLSLDNEDKQLQQLEDEAEKRSQFLQSFQADYKRLQESIKSKEALFNSVLERLQQIDLGRRDGGFTINMVAPPDVAAQVEPNRLKVYSVAIFLGLAAGLGLAYLVDMADKSFRNPEEVRHELGMPILGHLPVIVTESRRRKKDAAPSAISDIVCTFHRPKSTYSEAYRAVRTALNFGIRGEGHKVIQVTSPDPGDGKSTLSGNLAVCMAQSGRRVLLVDADFRRPRVHRLFGVEAGQGMSSVIKGTADLPEAIMPTEVENLFLLPCGPRPSNPSELLSSTRFSELIHVLREQYDIVIIDTPPVLAVTDPCVVAPRVDGVVLLIRITKHVRPHAKRALESLESLGANLIGIVVNGVGGNRPGMGYGFGSQYGYRYATNSGYYDSYSYNYGGYHHYYEDAETPSEEQVLRSEGYVRTPPDERA